MFALIKVCRDVCIDKNICGDVFIDKSIWRCLC